MSLRLWLTYNSTACLNRDYINLLKLIKLQQIFPEFFISSIWFVFHQYCFEIRRRKQEDYCDYHFFYQSENKNKN